MSIFIAEQGKTSGKMSDLVLEYVSQFIARDYFENYEKASGPDQHNYVPTSLDEKIYRNIACLFRKKTGQNAKLLRGLIFSAAAAVCVACIIFTAAVLLNNSLRFEIINSFSSFVVKH